MRNPELEHLRKRYTGWTDEQIMMRLNVRLIEALRSVNMLRSEVLQLQRKLKDVSNSRNDQANATSDLRDLDALDTSTNET